ncbi:MAG: type IV toxin-antitoxin system AbiEi family antitoxin [Fibrobacter sp.]|nr:type IV toxin-antitoxin system AbiEi family antitoxin [Fibrobacter sp.]
MNISEWIHSREIRGKATFSIVDVKDAFAERPSKSINTELSRQVSRGRVQSVYRGFYVIVPVQYQLKGVIPPVYYVDDLMDYVGKPYYVGLLSAAAMYGASHQRAMKTQVMTVVPRIKASGKNSLLDWNYRQEIPEAFVMKKNAEIGTLRYSGPELTAVDLVQFASHVGGYQRVATVLAELMDSLDMGKVDELLPFTTVATVQRLGYLLECVLSRQDQADALFQVLKMQGSWNSILLNNDQARREEVPANRWHVNGNIDIEVDDL